MLTFAHGSGKFSHRGTNYAVSFSSQKFRIYERDQLDRPDENEKIQLVAILRSLKKNQDEVADILKMRKERVGLIEDWLKTAPSDSVEGLFVDYRLQKVVSEKLTDYAKLLPRDFVEAARLKPDDILEHYREDYSPKPPVSPAQDDLTTSKLYQEHQNGLIHLAERLMAELEPHLSVFRLRSLEGRGTHSKSVRESGANHFSLTWQVKGGGSVYLHYGLELAEDTETKIMRGYLEQHLRSSSYSWLMEDNEKGINELKRLCGEELKGRTRLLRQIDRKVEKLTNKPLADPNRMNYTGPSTWFSDSIWAAVLDGLYNTLDYKVEPIDSGLFKAQYGATFIGLTATRQEGEQYVDWHKKLMARSERSRTVKAINQLKKGRESVANGIREVLTKFVVDKYIPGKCDYDFCRAMVTLT